MLFGIIVLVAGVLYLLFNIFVNSGGKAKFKSDLPPTEQVKKRGKVKCYILMSLACLVGLFLLFMLLSLIL